MNQAQKNRMRLLEIAQRLKDETKDLTEEELIAFRTIRRRAASGIKEHNKKTALKVIEGGKNESQ